MDEASNSYTNIDNQDLYLWDYDFDFAEEVDLTKISDFGEEVDPSKIFDDFPQDQPLNTNIRSSALVEYFSPNQHQNSENLSELPNVNPKTLITIPIVMEKQCDASNISRRSDQENPKTNGVLLQQPLPKIPILEKFEREASLKSKCTIDQPLKTSTDSWNDPPTTNGVILQRPMSNILTLEKLKSHLMRSKSMVGHENGIFKQGIIDHIGGYGILNSSDNNEFPQKTSTNGGPIRRSPNRTSSRYQPYFGKLDSCQVAEIWKQNYNNEEALVGRSSNLVNHSNHNFQRSPVYTHEITNKFKGVASGQNYNQYTKGNEDGAPDQLQSSWEQSWNTQDTTTNWSWSPFR